jgi:uncharacterized protein YbaR (Trm112 family)
MIRALGILGLLVHALGCERAPQPPTNAAKPAAKSAAVVPDGFDQQLLDILRCPENLTVVRLASRKELDATNERIKKGKLKNWGGKTVTKPLEAMLIRADEKIGYRFEGAVPVMIIEEALVLNETVGKRDPDKHRK